MPPQHVVVLLSPVTHVERSEKSPYSPCQAPQPSVLPTAPHQPPPLPPLSSACHAAAVARPPPPSGARCLFVLTFSCASQNRRASSHVCAGCSQSSVAGRTHWRSCACRLRRSLKSIRDVASPRCWPCSRRTQTTRLCEGPHWARGTRAQCAQSCRYEDDEAYSGRLVALLLPARVGPHYGRLSR